MYVEGGYVETGYFEGDGSSYPQTLTLSGDDVATVSSPAIRLQYRDVLPSAIDVTAEWGSAYVWLARQWAYPAGIGLGASGTTSVNHVLGTLGYAVDGYLIDDYVTNRSWIDPSGVDAGGQGETTVENLKRYLLPSGFESAGFGDTVALPARVLYPSGIVSTLKSGTPTLENKNREILPKGMAPPALGSLTIEYLKRTLSLSGFSPLTFGTAALENLTQQVYPSGADLLVAKTTARVEYRVRTLTGTGWSALATGTGKVEPGEVTLSGSGWDSAVAGEPVATKRIRTIKPSSLPVTWVVGEPSLELQNRNLYPTGKSALGIGAATIDNWVKYLKPSGIGSLSFGGTGIESTIRYVYPDGVAAGSAGTPWISDSPRYLELASGIKELAFGTPTMGYGRVLQPQGWNDEKFGKRIVPEDQIVYSHGFVGKFGEATVTNLDQTITAKGFLTVGREEYRWGSPEVWNFRQYITQFAQPNNQSGLTPASLAKPTIENCNRTSVVDPAASPPSVPGPYIYNNARLVKPSGAVPVTPRGVLQITHGIRTFTTDGFSTLTIRKTHRIALAGRALTLSGIASAAYGEDATVASNRRTFKIKSNLDSLAAGLPMIAFAIRSITFSTSAKQKIAPPSMPTPLIKLGQRYVSVSGFETFGDNVPEARIHWNTIEPPGAKAPSVGGTPTIENLTPEVYPYGEELGARGTPTIRTQWRKFSLDGFKVLSLGKPTIADRRLHIYPSGRSILLFGTKAKVQNVKEDPPAAQRVVVGSISLLQFGSAKSNYLSAFPEGFVTLGFGAPTVVSNCFDVTPGIGSFAYGTPTVTLSINTITVTSIGQSPEFDTSAYPRITPWTIWAPNGAPARAVEILGQSGKYIDVGGNADSPGIKLGSPTVTHRNRSVGVSVGDGIAYGTPTAMLKKRYLTPTGFTPTRKGYPSLGPYTQTAEQYGDDTEVPDTTYGTPTLTIHYTGPQTITGSGWESFDMGTADPELFNRTVVPRGFSALGMGNSNDEPSSPSYGHQWQKLHVGAPNPTAPDGWDSEDFGTSWISLKIRDVQAEGFETFECDYTVDDFDERMTVTQERIEIASQAATASGFATLGVATPDIKLKTQYIRPDGNSETYRKGAPLS